MFNLFNGNKKITEMLYAQNLELAVKNKTLSLLEKLYQTSTQTLMPEEMAKAITNVICKDLNLEFAGVFVFKKETDSLNPLSFSKSERLSKVLTKIGFSLDSISIKDVSKRDFLKKVIYNQEPIITNNFEEIFKDLVNQNYLKEVKKESHIKTALIYPLMTGQEVFAMLLLGFNRDYETLNAFEKASIKSFINVIALLINKAYLYKGLQNSYEVTKKAYALEKKAKEEIEQLDKVKDQFMSTLQHDLRTPLTSIMGYADLILGGSYGKQNAKTTEVIKNFQVLAKGMIRKASDFLDATQFQLGKGAVQLKPKVELLPILDEIDTELKLIAEQKGISLDFKKPNEIFYISADREKLKSAIFNIIDNSIKYTSQGGVWVKVGKQEKKVLIEIKDTGIGIEKDRLANLFENIGQRGERAKKEHVSGKGMGLYLAGQIIKYHDGKVWAESEGEGKGSVFHVELPLS